MYIESIFLVSQIPISFGRALHVFVNNSDALVPHTTLQEMLPGFLDMRDQAQGPRQGCTRKIKVHIVAAAASR
jgi:hypothetical protein